VADRKAQKSPGSKSEANAAKAAAQRSEPKAAAEKISMDAVRVPTAKLDQLRLQTEALLSEKLDLAEHAAELQALQTSLLEWQRHWSHVKADVRGLQAQHGADSAPDSKGLTRPEERILEFLDWNKAFINALEGRINGLNQAAIQSHARIGAKTDALLNEAKPLATLPSSWLLDALGDALQEAALDSGKQVDFTAEGGSVELDRRILTELTAPLRQLFRNMLEHSIEPPAERLLAKKPEQASVAIRVAALGTERVEISIGDDGRGIDVEKVKSEAIAARRLGVAESARLGEIGALELLFRPSSLPSSSLASGRGLGLPVLREKVERLGGTVAITTRLGLGTTLLLTLPLFLGPVRGVIVQERGNFFVIPSSSIERATRVRREQIRTVDDRDVVELEGEMIALVALADILDLPERQRASGNKIQLLVLASGSTRIAFEVDEMCGEQEARVLNLGPQLERLAHVAGACVLGSGKLAPVLDPAALVRTALRYSQSGVLGSLAISDTEGLQMGRKHSILVAEDSVTSRVLLKGILEAAGFSVDTAEDGMDALLKLKSAKFDLLVSDVEMPRLTGLGLTERIRADKRLAELPVVLLTSFDSRADLEPGRELGADAAIAKQSFEPNALLEAIRHLL
jgi:two-component system, chemotaxis family, sensor kinase CheA